MVATVWGDGTPQEAFDVPPDSIIVEQAANYVVLTSDAHKVLDYIGAGGHTFTLPAATAAGNGFTLFVRNLGAGNLTLAPTGADTVNGAASFVMPVNSTVQLIVKGTNYGLLYTSGVGATAVGTSFTPAGNIAATNVQAALQELDAEKALLAGNAAQIFRVATAVGANDAVPLSQVESMTVSPAELLAQTHTAFLTAGTSVAYTLTPTIVQAAYIANMRFRVKFHVASGATPTLNVSGLGAINLKQYDSAGAKVALGVGQAALNMLTDIEYDGVDFVVLDRLAASGLLLAFTKITATNATWAPNALTKSFTTEVVAGGGTGGNGGQGGGGISAAGGGGGSAGESLIGHCTTVTGTYAATIGAAATASSFIGTGISVTAAGGINGGTGTATATGGDPGVGGGGGSVTGGTDAMPGGGSGAGNGGRGDSIGGGYAGGGGAGAAGRFGKGGNGAIAVAGINPGQSNGGAAAVNTGAGGGGAAGSIGLSTGGAGGTGVIYVWEYA